MEQGEIGVSNNTIPSAFLDDSRKTDLGQERKQMNHLRVFTNPKNMV